MIYHAFSRLLEISTTCPRFGGGRRSERFASVLAPVGLYHVADWPTPWIETVYDGVHDRWVSGDDARVALLARVRPVGRPPVGAERYLTRPDGFEVVYCWTVAEGMP